MFCDKFIVSDHTTVFVSIMSNLWRMNTLTVLTRVNCSSRGSILHIFNSISYLHPVATVAGLELERPLVDQASHWHRNSAKNSSTCSL